MWAASIHWFCGKQPKNRQICTKAKIHVKLLFLGKWNEMSLHKLRQAIDDELRYGWTNERTNEWTYRQTKYRRTYEKSSAKYRHTKEQWKCPKSNIDKDIRAYQWWHDKSEIQVKWAMQLFCWEVSFVFADNLRTISRVFMTFLVSYASLLSSTHLKLPGCIRLLSGKYSEC